MRRFEEFVDGGLGTMTGEQACSGFCTDSFHSFSLYFPLFDGSVGEFFVFLLIRVSMREMRGCRRLGSI